jgi:hypothetical protein
MKITDLMNTEDVRKLRQQYGLTQAGTFKSFEDYVSKSIKEQEDV